MHRRILAFDFDGTLAENGVVPPQLSTALEQLYAAGYVLFLVTGRLTKSLSFGGLGGLFTGIIWENGAVLYDSANDETHFPFDRLIGAWWKPWSPQTSRSNTGKPLFPPGFRIAKQSGV